MGQPISCARVLALSSFTPQLGGDLTDLSNPCWPDQVPHRKKSSRRADGDPSANVEMTILQIAAAPPGQTDSDCLCVEELFDGECVMELFNVEIG